MPYNSKTALENQKAFLRSQSKCGFTSIEKRAKETLRAIEEKEKQADIQRIKIKIFNEKWNERRKNNK